MSLGPPVTLDSDETSQVLCVQIKEEDISDEEYGHVGRGPDDGHVERPQPDLRCTAGADFSESQASDEIRTVVVKSEEEEEDEHQNDDSPRASKKLAEKELCFFYLSLYHSWQSKCMMIIPKTDPISLIQSSLFLYLF